MSRERQAYRIRHRSHEGPLLAAIFLVGASIMASPFLSDRPAVESKPASPATSTPLIPTPEPSEIEERAVRPQLPSNLLPIEIVVARNFGLDSPLRERILEGYYRLGYESEVATCLDENGEHLIGSVALPAINVRKEPGVNNPPSRQLTQGAKFHSRFKIGVSHWMGKFKDTWRGIEKPSGDLEFIAQYFQGKTHLSMNSPEFCTPINLEPNIFRIKK